jgi:RimJ/RimL family protein N-acetyltransferase
MNPNERMNNDSAWMLTDWRRELPAMTSRLVALREPTSDDLGPLFDLLSIADAVRFGINQPVTEEAVRAFIGRARHERSAGISFTYLITLGATRAIVGLAQVRQLDPSFETATWEMTLAPSARGTGVFLDAARLLGSFAFGSVGTHRLESRVVLQNGRANGALNKLGAVQEGILRSSARQSGAYHDQVLWSMLEDDWNDHWVPTASRVH